ncbi:hypothetical protein [Porphyrobacter sp. HT-58-2]|uniref:hypothetical protein n=1 Tax=Porphyrobacter sp. HT-58-2 TaxID=2023229 RepID=UPI0011B000A4|nr:hypothetical protein [Porphyrobacter sp. HT-58-2]
MTAAASQMLSDHRKIHRDRLGEALIAQPGRRDNHDAAAPAAFNLRIETMSDQIGDRVETLTSHRRRRTS